MNSVAYIREHVIQLISEHYQLSEKEKSLIVVDLDIESKFGDLSCNAAMVLAKKFEKSPRDVATEITTLIESSLVGEHENGIAFHVKKTSVAGPGFVNIVLTEETWHTTAHEFAVHPQKCFQLFDDEVRKKYLVEFVSANPTGPLSLAHGRNAIIGDVLSRVLTFLGHSVCREYYINDAGQQLKNLGASLKALCSPKKTDEPDVEELEYSGQYMHDLAQKCVAEKGARVCEKDDEYFAEYAKNFFLGEIQKDLASYKIGIDSWFSEKELFETGKISETIKFLFDKDLAYKEDGAIWFKTKSFGEEKDMVIVRKDGEPTYTMADIAYERDKFARNFDCMVLIIGQDHHGFTKRLSALMKALDLDVDKFKFILYQLVRMKQGGQLTRMSKRAGNFLALRDVVDAVGSDAARYFYLNRKIESHLELDLDVAMKQDVDNPVYYIHYAYVRSGAVFKKAAAIPELADYVEKLITKTLNEVDTKALEHDFEDAEIHLLKKVSSLRDILCTIAVQHQTHLLAVYAYELAQSFHSYYNSERILDESDLTTTRSRLLLIRVVRSSISLCLDLLGLTKPDRM